VRPQPQPKSSMEWRSLMGRPARSQAARRQSAVLAAHLQKLLQSRALGDPEAEQRRWHGQPGGNSMLSNRSLTRTEPRA
jgi:hypothetical protein